MMVLPSDHLIKYTSLFLSTLSDAYDVAEQGENLVTLGIAPDSPETGYGYIKFQPEQTLGSHRLLCGNSKPLPQPEQRFSFIHAADIDLNIIAQ